MRTLFAMLIVAALAAPLAAGVDPATAPLGTQRYLVAFVDMPRESAGDTYAGATVVDNLGGLRMLVVETNDAALFEARVQLDDNVRYLQPDDPHAGFLHMVPNDSLYSNAGHYGSKIIGGEAAWDRTTGSTAVKVAMVDSGLNKAHEEFAGQSRVLNGYDYYNNDNDPDDTSGCSYHGTHTSGTSGATINNAKGIAGMSQHSIMMFKAFQNGGFGCGGSTTALVNALRAAGDNGAHVSSNSWGSSASNSAFNDAITYSHNLGVIHVASAGNSGPCTNCVGFPWRDMQATVIVVSSTTSSDTQSSFSSEGAEVDVGAPGSSILSSTSGTTGYGTLSGTSMAAPHVSGTVALIKALQPSYTFSQVESRLCSTAVDLGAAGEDHEFGCGRINADAATNFGPPPTPQCSDGVDNDGDGLTDHPNDPGCTDANDNDETDTPPPQAMHVDALTGWATHSNGNRHVLHCEATIVDAGGAAVSGATVTILFTKVGGGTASTSGATGATGSVELTVQDAKKHGTASCEVTNVVKTGWTYDSAANVVTSTSFPVA